MYSSAPAPGWPTPPTSPPHVNADAAWQRPPATTAQPSAAAPTTGWGNASSLTVGDPLGGRGRSNSDVQKPSWDSVPGWSSTAPVAPVSGSGWNASQPSQASVGGWAQPQQRPAVDRFSGAPNAAIQASWGQTDQKPSQWAPLGWAPLPPAPSANGTPATTGWDAKVPGSVAPPTIQVSTTADARPQAARWAPDISVPGPDQGGLLRGDNFQREVRKAKSASGLEQQRHAPTGGAYPNSRLPGKSFPGKNDKPPLGDEDDEKKVKKDNRQPPSMRLFTRSFAEVNKSLGVPDDEVKEVKLRRSDRPTHRGERDVSKAVGVYIYGLPKWVRVPEILAIFSDFGAIVNVAIVSKPRKDDPRSYAYVDYEAAGPAAKAIETLKAKTFFDMKQPLELRPHFDRSAGEAWPESTSEKRAPSSDRRGENLATTVAAPATDGNDKLKPAYVVQRKTSGDVRSVQAKSESQNFDYQTLHLANLPATVDKSDLEKLFSSHGSIRRIHIVQRPKDNKAFAFVSFKAANSAREALKAVKETRPFNMSENLKIEYSRSDSRERSRTTVEEKATTSKRSKTLERLPKERRNSRTVIFVRDVDEKGDSVREKFAGVGGLKSFHVVPRVDGGGFCAVVCFEKGEDATKAVKDKLENAVFPRQRRLTLTRLPTGVTESDLKTWLAGTGEIRRVDVKQDDDSVSTSTSAEIEFAKGDAAIVAFLHVLENQLKDVKVSVGYSPSKNKKEEEDDGEEGEKTGTPNLDIVGGEESHAGGDDYFGSSSEDEGEVEVVNLQDLA
ncbi:hypothetical protein HDU67_008100 [Dinochytrium kinnereticum]|nr:hypothetical protein HDU67_008100 [Dinochytrium kinnereticum]